MSTVEGEREKYIKIEVCKKRENLYSESAQQLIAYAQN